MTLNQSCMDVDWVAFDTETSGKYPVDSEICEIAAVRWSKGKIVGSFQTLLSVSKPMSEEVIAIHHITNEMLNGAPSIQEKLPEFLDFCKGAYLIAHHAPFDLGFIAIEIEKLKLQFPPEQVFCSSLLARSILLDSPNHRLQTLVQHYGLEQREAHRALSDAESCLDVALLCFQKKSNPSLEELQKLQGRFLGWKSFSLKDLRAQKKFEAMVDAVENKTEVQIEYLGGSKPGQARTVNPIGIVLSPGQDFLVASDPEGGPAKRFYLNKIKASRN